MPPHAQSASPETIARPSNRFLARLPRESHQRLLSQCSRVTLQKQSRLCEAGSLLTWSYFPCAGLVSLQTMTEEGETVEVAMIGNEGIVGLPVGPTFALAPHTALVVLPGEALRLPADVLHKELERDNALQRALMQYWHTLIIQIAQGSVCHRFHTARQRLACWLLAASDRTQSPRIHMTQAPRTRMCEASATRVLARSSREHPGAFRHRRKTRMKWARKRAT